MLENHEITPEEESAIKEGLEELTHVDTLLEECNEFATPVPITHDASIGEFVGHYEILDTRLTTPVYDYFNDATDPPTTEGLLATLQEVSSTSNPTIATDSVCGRYDSVSNECCFSLNDSATRKGDVCLQNTTIQRLPLSSRTPLIIGPSETLKGSGNIEGDVFISGVLSPGNSPGVVNISGDLTIDGGHPDVIDDSYSPPSPSGSDTVGEIVIEIGGLTPGPGLAKDIDNGYDQIKVTGNVHLGGTLNISLINDFTPTLGDTFEFLTFGSVAGAFEEATGLFGFGDGSLYLDIVSLTDRLQLVVKQIPGSPNLKIDTATQDEDNALGKVFAVARDDLSSDREVLCG